MRCTLVVDSDGNQDTSQDALSATCTPPKHFLVIENQERWIVRRVGPVITQVVKGRSQRLFQLSIGHRRKLHVVFPCVTRHAGYNRVTLLLRHQEDHYAQPCSEKDPPAAIHWNETLIACRSIVSLKTRDIFLRMLAVTSICGMWECHRPSFNRLRI